MEIWEDIDIWVVWEEDEEHEEMIARDDIPWECQCGRWDLQKSPEGEIVAPCMNCGNDEIPW